MANRYWVGGSASWDGTASTKWALTSGGLGGQAVPTSADDVFFDGASGAVTCTIAAGNTGAKSINCTGFTGTLTGSTQITVSGNVTLSTGMTWSYSGTIQINATSTITSAGKTWTGSGFNVTGSGITVSLGDAYTTTGNLLITQGTFNTNNFNVTASGVSSSFSSARTINLGSSTITLTGSGTSWQTGVTTNLTLNAGTSTIIFSGNPTFDIAGGAFTFYNVSFTNSSTTASVTLPQSIDGTTFNNITVTGPATAGTKTVNLASRITINGSLSTTGTAGNCRVFFRGSTYGIAHTLTINSTPSLTDADFRDIYVIGTAAPISGTRIGNRGSCRGITFSAPKTVYWNLAGAQNWSANGWTDTATGTPSTDFFPLPQDTATFTNSGSVTGTITFDTAIAYVPNVDMSGRTSAMTISVAQATIVYGNWTNGSGTTISGVATVSFSGGNTQTITSAGRTLSFNITIDSYGGTVQLADALNIGGSQLTITNGAFDTKNFNVTAGTLSSSNSNVRSITLGSSTVTLSSSITFTNSLNLTFNAGTSTISLTSSVPTVDGGNVTFYNVTTTNISGIGSFTLNGNNTFNNLTAIGAVSTGVGGLFLGGNQTITGTLTVAGATPIRRVFVRSNTEGTTRTLTVNTLSAQDSDWRDITIAGAAAGSSPTRAGDCGNNSGITFPAAKTVYWNLAGAQNWSATGWATLSGGTPNINNFPLAQDTAKFDEAVSSVTGTITIDSAWNIGTFDASARTSAMTLSIGTNSPRIYGDWKFGTGVTSSSTTGVLTFQKNGIQTITSNGITFGCNITINNPLCTVQLADALSLNSSRTLTITLGTFDAVTYNVTTGLFTFSAGTLKMGSGTWTLSGTGTVWNVSTVSNLYKGTANIVLSDTSTSSRTFTPGIVSSLPAVYNKLTIGGTTGISTLMISGAAHFDEIASTKTVAHTINLPSTFTVTVGKWSVTGTLGNVVTIGPSVAASAYTLSIEGAATSGIDYLSISYCTVSSTSPGEFYVGANSTNTAGNTRVIFTAPPAARTLYWVGGTGNWSDTTHWSTTSGSGSGANIPTSLDAVIFDSGSNATAYTVTIDAGVSSARCASFTMAGPASGNVTFAGSVAIAFHGNVSFAASGITRTYTGVMSLSGSATGKTFTTNGLVLASNITVNGRNCGWGLGSALDISPSNNLSVFQGTFDLNNYNLTALQFTSGGGKTRTINCGSSTITQVSTAVSMGTTILSFNSELTFNAGTSLFVMTYGLVSFDGGGKTFYDVNFSSATISDTQNLRIEGQNTFNNLTFAAPGSTGIRGISFSANQTILGTLTISAGSNATRRTFVGSTTPVTSGLFTGNNTRTLTCNAVAALSDVDFQDITIAGAAAPISGTRLGNCTGNSGITFPAAKTVYWNLAGSNNWSATGWAASSGASPSLTNFPLAQDTAIFESTSPGSGSTITIDFRFNIGTIDMSARTTNLITLAAGATTPLIYGNWINGTGTTISFATGNFTFCGNVSQTITSAGKSFSAAVVISTTSTVTLTDAANFSNGLTLTKGTFNTASYNVTGTFFSSIISNVRALVLGSSTVTLSNPSGVWSTTGSNITVSGTGTISLTSATAKQFSSAGLSFSGITLNQGGAGALTITGNNTFKDITNSYSSTGATSIIIGTTTQTVTKWTGKGEVGKVLTVQGTSATSPGTLIFSGSGIAVGDVDQLLIYGIRAYSLNSTWYAGKNSTNIGSLGWIFSAFNTGNFFMFF